MATEIERKFLVTGNFRNDAIKEINIIQAYLTVDPFKTTRIRLTDDEAYITIKSARSGASLARGEWEFKIPAEDAKELINICLPGRIIKTRYIIPWGKHKFEVDVFHDKNEGLIIAEIELSSENESFNKPAWLGKEVTGDPAYYNSSLIK
ncbi:MAG TPA: CYTH domain-containing protein [Bacteroidales bacterium]|nr:CYTH domain-containing protein [Bacteroidales bacterium]